jgi:hypothetical protein
MRVPAAESSWARRSEPAAQGINCLTTRWNLKATLLADAADALAQDLAILRAAPCDYSPLLRASPSRQLSPASASGIGTTSSFEVITRQQT